MSMRRTLSSFGLSAGPLAALLALVLGAACAGSSSLKAKAITAPTAAPPPAVNPFAGARF